jgi:hypothetical protein
MWKELSPDEKKINHNMKYIGKVLDCYASTKFNAQTGPAGTIPRMERQGPSELFEWEAEVFILSNFLCSWLLLWNV